MTRQRKIILEQLREIDTHPAADEVYEMVRRRLPRISLGTVYRNLEVLSARGMIRKLELGGSQRRFDGDMANHYHVRCIRCDRVEDAPIEAIAEVEDTVRGASDFEIVGHQLQFFGICPTCKKQGSNSQGKSRDNDRRET
jgi:Fur family ferric uptake transcriptional regulator